MPIGRQSLRSWQPPRVGSSRQLGKLLPSPNNRQHRVPPFQAWLRSTVRICQTSVTNHANSHPRQGKPRQRPGFADLVVPKSLHDLSLCISLPSTAMKQMHRHRFASALELGDDSRYPASIPTTGRGRASLSLLRKAIRSDRLPLDQLVTDSPHRLPVRGRDHHAVRAVPTVSTSGRAPS